MQLCICQAAVTKTPRPSKSPCDRSLVSAVFSIPVPIVVVSGNRYVNLSKLANCLKRFCATKYISGLFDKVLFFSQQSFNFLILFDHQLGLIFEGLRKISIS